MELCAKCGHEISDGGKFCPHCGQPQPSDTAVDNSSFFVVEREKSLSGALSNFYIKIDDTNEYKVENGKKIKIPMEEGKHSIKITMLAKRECVEIDFPLIQLLKLSLNKLTGAIEYLLFPNSNMAGAILGVPVGSNPNDAVMVATNSIGGMFKKAVAGAQEGIHKALANSETQKRVLQIIEIETKNILDEDLDVLIRYSVEVGPKDLFVDWVKVALIEKDSSILSRYSDDKNKIYDSFFMPIMEKVLSCEGYDIYWQECQKNIEKFINKIANTFFYELLRENNARVKTSLQVGFETGAILNRIGIEGFFEPKIIACKMESNFRTLEKFSNGVATFDDRNIVSVRKWLATKTFDEIRAEYGLTNSPSSYAVSLNDKDKKRVYLFRIGNNVHFVYEDSSYITNRTELANIRKHIEKIYALDKIAYFKEDGEYHRDLKVSGGGTNLFLSQSTLVRGSYTDKVKSETVVTDTRYTKILLTNNKTIDLTFDSYEKIKRIMPEKEYDVVDAINENKIISGGSVAMPAVTSAKSNSDDSMEKFEKLKKLFENGLISQEEYDQKRKDLLDSM